ncbi:MAG: hypothetical protein AB4372_06090 [Xenococcus sp. (in: cyanobacteria)]
MTDAKILRSKNIPDLPKNISNKNLKHIRKHLSEFQKYDSTITINDVIKLGENIAQNTENLISTPSGKQVFEKDVTLGEQMVRVRVVRNPLGNLRSVHIRY